jgi:hypothetical protein
MAKREIGPKEASVIALRMRRGDNYFRPGIRSAEPLKPGSSLDNPMPKRKPRTKPGVFQMPDEATLNKATRGRPRKVLKRKSAKRRKAKSK